MRFQVKLQVVFFVFLLGFSFIVPASGASLYSGCPDTWPSSINWHVSSPIDGLEIVPNPNFVFENISADIAFDSPELVREIIANGPNLSFQFQGYEYTLDGSNWNRLNANTFKYSQFALQGLQERYIYLVQKKGCTASSVITASRIAPMINMPSTTLTGLVDSIFSSSPQIFGMSDFTQEPSVIKRLTECSESANPPEGSTASDYYRSCGYFPSGTFAGLIYFPKTLGCISNDGPLAIPSNPGKWAQLGNGCTFKQVFYSVRPILNGQRSQFWLLGDVIQIAKSSISTQEQPNKPSDNQVVPPLPAKSTELTKLLKWKCSKGKVIKQFQGKVVKCPLGYKLKK